MTILAMVFILISAIIHASWNYLSKKANGGIPFIWLFTLIASIVYLPLFILSVKYFNFTLNFNNIFFLLGSIIIHLIYFLLLFKGYKVGDLSIVYPVARGSAPMMTVIIASVLFNEKLSIIAYLGIIFIIVGIFLLTGGLNIFKDRNNLLAISYGLLVGIAITSYTLLDKAIVSIVFIFPLILDYFNTIGRLILLSPIVFKSFDKVKYEWKNHKKEAFLVAIFNSLGYIIVLLVLRFAPVSYVAPVREISILFGTLIGVKVLNEHFGLNRIIYALLITIGVVVIAYTTL
ncbi:DMT family transporter [Clostridiaceae bacterium HSG29]|nr:DMT family transporter [Clostridiaceae bacterium HSG29]